MLSPLPPSTPFHVEFPGLNPELTLVASLIAQAVEDLKRWTKRREAIEDGISVNRKRRDLKHQRRAIKFNAIIAYWWLHDMPTPRGRLSFAECCQYLDFLDVAATRRHILDQFEPDALAPLGRAASIDFLMSHYFPPAKEGPAHAHNHRKTRKAPAPGGPT